MNIIFSLLISILLLQYSESFTPDSLLCTNEEQSRYIPLEDCETNIKQEHTRLFFKAIRSRNPFDTDFNHLKNTLKQFNEQLIELFITFNRYIIEDIDQIIDLINNYPNLQVLQINIDNTKNNIETITLNALKNNFPSLKKLYFLSKENGIKHIHTLLTQITEKFPNLTYLELNFEKNQIDIPLSNLKENQRQFPVLYMPMLQKLYLYFNYNNFESISIQKQLELKAQNKQSDDSEFDIQAIELILSFNENIYLSEFNMDNMLANSKNLKLFNLFLGENQNLAVLKQENMFKNCYKLKNVSLLYNLNQVSGFYNIKFQSLPYLRKLEIYLQQPNSNYFATDSFIENCPNLIQVDIVIESVSREFDLDFMNFWYLDIKQNVTNFSFQGPQCIVTNFDPSQEQQRIDFFQQVCIQNTCKNNQYLDQFRRQCEDCSFNCDACRQKKDLCIKCRTDMYIDSKNSCQYCELNQYCQECDYQGHCKECINGGDPMNECKCKNYYYGDDVTVDSSQCQTTCSPLCKKCGKYWNICEECIEDIYREIRNFQCGCLQGYYIDGMNNYKCTKCEKQNENCNYCHLSFIIWTPEMMQQEHCNCYPSYTPQNGECVYCSNPSCPFYHDYYSQQTTQQDNNNMKTLETSGIIYSSILGLLLFTVLFLFARKQYLQKIAKKQKEKEKEKQQEIEKDIEKIEIDYQEQQQQYQQTIGSSTQFTNLQSQREQLIINKKDNISLGPIDKEIVKESDVEILKLEEEQEERKKENEDINSQTLESDTYKKQLKTAANIQEQINLRQNSFKNIEEFDEKYQKIEVIGRGMFGKVFQIQNTETGQIFALKQIKTEDQEQNKIIQQELIVNQQLQQDSHKNLTTAIELYYGEYNNNNRRNRVTFKYYIVMEMGKYNLLEYIQQKIEKEEVFSQQDVLSYLKQIIDAITHLQKYDIIHRDIKPQNIIVMGDGSIKLSDFGVSKLTKNNKNSYRTLSMAQGTPCYMSPEMYRKMKQLQELPLDQVDKNKFDIDYQKSDIYSLGLTILQLLNLLQTYELQGINCNEKSQQLEIQLEKIKHKELKELLQKMLQFYPQNRIDLENINQQLLKFNNVQ